MVAYIILKVDPLLLLSLLMLGLLLVLAVLMLLAVLVVEVDFVRGPVIGDAMVCYTFPFLF